MKISFFLIFVLKKLLWLPNLSVKIVKEADMSMDCELLTESQVSDILKLSIKTLQQKRSAGKPPAFIKLGGGAAVRYRKEDILAYIEGSRVTLKGENYD